MVAIFDTGGRSPQAAYRDEKVGVDVFPTESDGAIIRDPRTYQPVPEESLPATERKKAIQLASVIVKELDRIRDEVNVTDISEDTPGRSIMAKVLLRCAHSNPMQTESIFYEENAAALETIERLITSKTTLGANLRFDRADPHGDNTPRQQLRAAFEYCFPSAMPTEEIVQTRPNALSRIKSFVQSRTSRKLKTSETKQSRSRNTERTATKGDLLAGLKILADIPWDNIWGASCRYYAEHSSTLEKHLNRKPTTFESALYRIIQESVGDLSDSSYLMLIRPLSRALDFELKKRKEPVAALLEGDSALITQESLEQISGLARSILSSSDDAINYATRRVRKETKARSMHPELLQFLPDTNEHTTEQGKPNTIKFAEYSDEDLDASKITIRLSYSEEVLAGLKLIREYEGYNEINFEKVALPYSYALENYYERATRGKPNYLAYFINHMLSNLIQNDDLKLSLVPDIVGVIHWKIEEQHNAIIHPTKVDDCLVFNRETYEIIRNAAVSILDSPHEIIKRAQEVGYIHGESAPEGYKLDPELDILASYSDDQQYERDIRSRKSSSEEFGIAAEQIKTKAKQNIGQDRRVLLRNPPLEEYFGRKAGQFELIAEHCLSPLYPHSEAHFPLVKRFALLLRSKMGPMDLPLVEAKEESSRNPNEDLLAYVEQGLADAGVYGEDIASYRAERIYKLRVDDELWREVEKAGKAIAKSHKKNPSLYRHLLREEPITEAERRFFRDTLEENRDRYKRARKSRSRRRRARPASTEMEKPNFRQIRRFPNYKDEQRVARPKVTEEAQKTTEDASNQPEPQQATTPPTTASAPAPKPAVEESPTNVVAPPPSTQPKETSFPERPMTMNYSPSITPEQNRPATNISTSTIIAISSDFEIPDIQKIARQLYFQEQANLRGISNLPRKFWNMCRRKARIRTRGLVYKSQFLDAKRNTWRLNKLTEQAAEELASSGQAGSRQKGFQFSQVNNARVDGFIQTTIRGVLSRVAKQVQEHRAGESFSSEDLKSLIACEMAFLAKARYVHQPAVVEKHYANAVRTSFYAKDLGKGIYDMVFNHVFRSLQGSQNSSDIIRKASSAARSSALRSVSLPILVLEKAPRV